MSDQGKVGWERLLQVIRERTGVNLAECFQCQKCSAGCPLAKTTDVLPHVLVRMVQLGLGDEVLRSKHLWLCMSCESCATRCPNQLRLCEAIDEIRHLALEQGLEPAESEVATFHRAMLDTLDRHGRLFELGMIARLKLRTGHYLKDAGVGWGLLRKGKLRFFASEVKNSGEIHALFRGGGHKE